MRVRVTSTRESRHTWRRSGEWNFQEAQNRSRKTALTMVFKLCQSAERKWRRLDGSHRLAEIVRGVKFKDGEKLTERAACNTRHQLLTIALLTTVLDNLRSFDHMRRYYDRFTPPSRPTIRST